MGKVAVVVLVLVVVVVLVAVGWGECSGPSSPTAHSIRVVSVWVDLQLDMVRFCKARIYLVQVSTVF